MTSETCHDVQPGIVAQPFAEITVPAERAGVPRHAFLDFIDKSAMGSMFKNVAVPDGPD